MKAFVLISAVLIHCSWSYASPGPEGSKAFAYVDTSGNRYECVYKPQPTSGANTPKTTNLKKFNEITPSYNNWQDIFGNIENQQRAAFEAAQSSFNGFNPFPYIPNFDFRFPSFQGYGMSGSNSAYAAGAVGPGYRRQVASINPANPIMPNVDSRYYGQPNPLGSGNDYYSVSSSSYSSSSNDNGKVQSQRGAETVVNDNGQVTRYSVHS